MGPESFQTMLSFTAGQPLTPVMGTQAWRWHGPGVGSASEWRGNMEFWLHIREAQGGLGAALEARVSAKKEEGKASGQGKP